MAAARCHHHHHHHHHQHQHQHQLQLQLQHQHQYQNQHQHQPTNTTVTIKTIIFTRLCLHLPSSSSTPPAASSYHLQLLMPMLNIFIACHHAKKNGHACLPACVLWPVGHRGSRERCTSTSGGEALSVLLGFRVWGLRLRKIL